MVSDSAPDSTEFDPSFDELDRRIRQGDVLTFIRQSSDFRDWSSHLAIVITANCDLAKSKHGGIISYVPLVPTSTYATIVTFPAIAESLRSKATSKLSTTLRSSAKEWPSQERISELIWDGKTSQEIEALLPPGGIRENVMCHIDTLVAYNTWQREHESSRTFHGCAQAIASFVYESKKRTEAKRRKKPPTLETLALEVIPSRFNLRSIPGDAMFFCRPAEPVSTSGHIAYLRIIRELDLAQIATSAAQEQEQAEVRARRIGRLSHLYLHRLTQKMAAVFTEIGLPDPYEKFQQELLVESAKKWFG